MALSIWQSYWISTVSGEAWTLAGLSGDWLVRPITTILSSYPTELAVSLAVVGLTALFLAGEAYFASRRRAAARVPAKAKAVAGPPAAVAPRERPIASGLDDLQAQAAQQIDAAEHALNRLLAECDGIAKLPVEPTLVPERQLKTAAPAPARQSLAA
jgi:hypothetical protein